MMTNLKEILTPAYEKKYAVGSFNSYNYETFRGSIEAGVETGTPIIAAFGAAIEQLVALAVLMPIVASIGGNAGTQTMAVTVRAIATNQLTRSNTRRILWRELRVAVLNGATIAVLIGMATSVIFTPMLGGVIAAAMVINVIVAGLAGVLVPVLFDRMNQDPAVASSVFVTMITDSMGFFAFLGLAVASGLAG